jgi:2-isopropylmalate synthase
MQINTGNDRVIVFDTTLRDGEQAPGASMNLSQKLAVARVLAQLGVDVIEAGFPIASPGDFESVQAIARQVEGPIIAGLARAHRLDIERCMAALAPAKKKRLHVFLATSPIHREFKLKMSREQVVESAVAAVAIGKGLTDDIEFSCEDAARTEPDFLCEVVERVIAAGATTVNIPDTVGYAMPSQYAELIGLLKRSVRGIDRAVLSVHCHNDLGLAVANSLAALQAGARQVECTINGLGERAGNCALEEVVMAIRTRADYLKLDTGIQTAQLCAASRVVASSTGFTVPRNKAVVGLNAFAHESGIHQHGMLRNAQTYEVMKPEDVGYRSTSLVLGKHSGRHALDARLKELGYELEAKQIDKVFDELKKLADKKKEIFDGDLEALLATVFQTGDHGHWTLVGLNAVSGTMAPPHAAVCLKRGNETVEDAATGDGPLDAIFKCIHKLTGVHAVFRNLEINSITEGEDAMGEALVDVEHEGRHYRGRGVDTDIIVAAAQAYVEVINRIAAGRLPRVAHTSEVICGAV